MGGGDAEVVEASGLSQGNASGLVDAVIADAVVADGCCGGRFGFGVGVVGGSRRGPVQGPVGSVMVEVASEGVERALLPGQAGGWSNRPGVSGGSVLPAPRRRG